MSKRKKGKKHNKMKVSSSRVKHSDTIPTTPKVLIDITNGVLTCDAGPATLRVELPDHQVSKVNSGDLKKRILTVTTTAISAVSGLVGIAGVLHQYGMIGFSSTPMTVWNSNSNAPNEVSNDPSQIRNISIDFDGSVIVTFGDEQRIVAKIGPSFSESLELVIYSPAYKANLSNQEVLEYVRQKENVFSDMIARVSFRGNVADASMIFETLNSIDDLNPFVY